MAQRRCEQDSHGQRAEQAHRRAHVNLDQGTQAGHRATQSAHLRKPLIIAIDGPSGAGKGRSRARCAAALGYRHVDSGAMYRAVGWKALHDEVSRSTTKRPSRRLAERVAHRRVGDRASRSTATTSRAPIRTPEIDRAAAVGGAAAARARRARRASARTGRRRRHRDGRARYRHGGVSGRRREDLSRCVARRARAPPRQRSGAHRRARQRWPTSRRCSPQRDEHDRTRTASPLYAAPDAVVVDTTGKTSTRSSKSVGDDET